MYTSRSSNCNFNFEVREIYYTAKESSMRSISKVVQVKPFADNSRDKQSYRVIGTVDVDG
jgi:hypothetical protein